MSLTHPAVRLRTAPSLLAALVVIGTTALVAVPRLAAAQTYTDCATVAGNLVQNCGFEGGTYIGGPYNYANVPDGYTLIGNNGGGFANTGSYAPAAHSGTHYFFFNDGLGTSATLAQALTTTVGTTYDISFYAYDYTIGSDPGALLSVTFGGLPVFSQTPPTFAPYGPSGYQQFTVTGVATGTNTILAFTGNRNAGLLYLDDLSVTPLGTGGAPSTTTPEPSTWALVGTGVAGLAGVAARRRRA